MTPTTNEALESFAEAVTACLTLQARHGTIDKFEIQTLREKLSDLRFALAHEPIGEDAS